MANSQKAGREILMQHTIFSVEHKGAWCVFRVFSAFALFGQRIFAGQKSRFVLRSNTHRIALKGGPNG
jgi:hypothetical protein